MKALVILMLIPVLGVVGSMDYEDELKQAEHYCNMVKAGNWPAYDNSINCEE